jgi:hypothetical protein
MLIRLRFARPEGANTRVVYLVQVALNGSIPSMLANAVANETPLCVGRARDVFYKRTYLCQEWFER